MNKVPLRRCVVTKEQFPKSELLRIVRTTDGIVRIDETGKLNGRGAYIKKDALVIEKAIKTKAIERELKVKISDSFYQELLNYLK